MMSGSTWLYADPHFSHKNIIRFTRDSEGLVPLRPKNFEEGSKEFFTSVQEHDELLIARYNSVVQPEDRVYILGDFGNWRVAERLLGRKVLVKGNHDTEKLSRYSSFFDDVRSCVPKKGFILSHIPLHPESLGRWLLNIHGHTHANSVPRLDGRGFDNRYICVSVEQTDFRPILLDRALKRGEIKKE